MLRHRTSLLRALCVAAVIVGLVLMIGGEGSIKAGGDFGTGALRMVIGLGLIIAVYAVHKKSAASAAHTNDSRQKTSTIVYHSERGVVKR